MEPASSAQDSTATTTSGMDVSRQSILPFGDLKERVGVSVRAENAEGCVTLARCSCIHVESHFATGRGGVRDIKCGARRVIAQHAISQLLSNQSEINLFSV